MYFSNVIGNSYFDRCVLSAALKSLREHVLQMSKKCYTETDDEGCFIRGNQRMLQTGSICPHPPCGIESNESEKERQKCCEQANIHAFL